MAIFQQPKARASRRGELGKRHHRLIIDFWIYFQDNQGKEERGKKRAAPAAEYEVFFITGDIEKGGKSIVFQGISQSLATIIRPDGLRRFLTTLIFQ
jgi:hypothetical protein